MQKKWLLITGVALSVIASFYYVIQLDLHMAILSMMALFALTNLMRANSFKAQGMMREAKWMQVLSLVFVALFVILLIVKLVS